MISSHSLYNGYEVDLGESPARSTRIPRAFLENYRIGFDTAILIIEPTKHCEYNVIADFEAEMWKYL